MKRIVVATLLLLGAATIAHADNYVFDNVQKQPRGDAALQADTEFCDQRIGIVHNGPVPARYRKCMLGRGWRYSHTTRDRTREHLYPDPDNPGLMCRDFTVLGVVGSQCSNF